MLKRLCVFGLPLMIVAVLWFAGWAASFATQHNTLRLDFEMVRSNVGCSEPKDAEESTVAVLRENSAPAREGTRDSNRPAAG